MCCSVLQCAALCCRLLQSVAVCYSTHLESLLTLLTERKEAQIMLCLQLVANNVHLEVNPEKNCIKYLVLGSRLDYTLDLLKFVTILFDTDSDSFSTTSYVTRLTATYCNTLTDQFSTISCATVHTATRCNTLQNTATHCNIRTPSCANLHRSASHPAILCNTLQHPREAHCTTLPLTATPHLA